jgi:hypothetical protein
VEFFRSVDLKQFTEEERLHSEIHDLRCSHCGGKMTKRIESEYGREYHCATCPHKHSFMTPQAATVRRSCHMIGESQ